MLSSNPHRASEPGRLASLDARVGSLAGDIKTCIELLQTQIQTHQTTFQLHSNSINELSGCISNVDGNVEKIHHQVSDIQEQYEDVQEKVDETMDVFGTILQEAQDVFELRTSQLKQQVDAQRREIDKLRKLFDDGPPQFPQFRRLPVEIRGMIWGQALPQRILTIEETVNKTLNIETMAIMKWSQYRFSPRLRPPAVAQACRESRAVACKAGQLVPLRNPQAYACLNGSIHRHSHMGVRKTQWSWFDPDRDSLRIKTAKGLYSTEVLEDMLSIVQSIIIDSPSRVLGMIFADICNQRLFPRLTEVKLAEDTVLLPPHSDPYTESQLFGVERTNPLAIDVDDSPLLEGIVRKLQHLKPTFIRNIDTVLQARPHIQTRTRWGWDEKDLENLIDPEVSENDWPKFNRFLVKAWDEVQQDWTEGENVNSKTALSNAPTFGRVVLFDVAPWQSHPHTLGAPIMYWVDGRDQPSNVAEL
ncbi:hypothetical protein TruAng_005131 [Truncatella angustata]|nr:hypothetical protein TruAng_005131 [Truncatella angustata]